jgi:hypothetical protein
LSKQCVLDPSVCVLLAERSGNTTPIIYFIAVYNTYSVVYQEYMYVYMTHIRAYTSVDILQYMLNYTYIYCYAGSLMSQHSTLLASGCREVCPGRPSPASRPPSPSFRRWQCARILRTGLRVCPNRNGPTPRASVEGQPTGS